MLTVFGIFAVFGVVNFGMKTIKFKVFEEQSNDQSDVSNSPLFLHGNLLLKYTIGVIL